MHEYYTHTLTHSHCIFTAIQTPSQCDQSALQYKSYLERRKVASLRQQPVQQCSSSRVTMEI